MNAFLFTDKEITPAGIKGEETMRFPQLNGAVEKYNWVGLFHSTDPL